MKKLLSAKEPFLLHDFASQCVKEDVREKWNPSQVRDIHGLQKHSLTVVDIACKQKSNQFYSGDDRLRQSVEIKLKDFLDFYVCVFEGRKNHWLCDVEELDFYLCQCPIAVYKKDTTCSDALLPHVMNEFFIPEIIQDVSMDQVNLWMSTGSTSTNIHYDAYQNILVVLYGCKTVNLYPPSDGPFLYPYPVYTKSANHSQVDFIQPNLELHPDFVKTSPRTFEVKEGNALFIPEGWWHQVKSDPFTIAVNYWFDGLRHKLTENPNMLFYYSRILMDEQLQLHSKHYLEELTRSSKMKVAGLDIGSVESIVSMLTDPSVSNSTCEAICMASDYSMMDKVQIFLAKNHVLKWRDMLYHATVDFVGFLSMLWERKDHEKIYSEIGVEQEYFEIIFDCFKEEKHLIKDQLIKKKNLFTQQLYHHVIALTFGT